MKQVKIFKKRLHSRGRMVYYGGELSHEPVRIHTAISNSYLACTLNFSELNVRKFSYKDRLLPMSSKGSPNEQSFYSEFCLHFLCIQSQPRWK